MTPFIGIDEFTIVVLNSRLLPLWSSDGSEKDLFAENVTFNKVGLTPDH